MYSNNILNFQESATILNARTKKSGNLLNAPHTLSISSNSNITSIKFAQAIDMLSICTELLNIV